MKRLGKSFSFLTKIMLIVGILISNLSSLSIVFASEVTIDVSVVDDKLYVKYLDELADDVKKVKINVYEKYTYLDGTFYQNEVVESNYDFSFVEEITENIETEEVMYGEVGETVVDEILVEETSEVLEDDGVFDANEENLVNVSLEDIENEDTEQGENILNNEIDENVNYIGNDKKIELIVDNTILSDVVFDGRYDVKIEIVDVTNASDEEVIDTRDFSMDIVHKNGIELTVVDAVTGEKLDVLENGRYVIDYSRPNVKVVARVLPGGLKPSDEFMYKNEYKCSAWELIELGFTSEFDFTGYLYGEYTIPANVVLSKYNFDTDLYEDIDFNEESLNVDVLYGTYELDALAMNVATKDLELDKSYVFNGNTKDGIVYVLLNKDVENTMLDLYNIANYMFKNEEYITFLLSNSEYEDVLSTYNEDLENISLNEYLASIKLDDSVVLSIVNDGLTITYKVVVAGDMDGDNVLTDSDLLDLINQVIEEKEVNFDKADLYGMDENVNTLDIIYLDQVMKNDSWNIVLNEEMDGIVKSELDVVDTDIVSGGQFTVNYIVKLSDYMINGVSGLFTYDEEMLELDSVEISNEWLGNSNNGKFIYIGEESLETPIENDDEVSLEVPLEENEENDILVVAEDISGDISENEEENITKDYVLLSAMFTAKKAGEHTISVENLEFFNQDTYYKTTDNIVSTVVVVNESDNNNLSSLVVAGQNIDLIEGQLDYEIVVSNDVTVAEVIAMVENVAADVTLVVSPDELVEGENLVTITVTAENGDVKLYTVKVIREIEPETETTTQVNYDNFVDTSEDVEEDDVDENVVVDIQDDDNDLDEIIEKESGLSRIVIIILILLVIGGLVYLIFKDEEDDEIRKINKEVKKLDKTKEEKNNNKSNKNFRN